MLSHNPTKGLDNGTLEILVFMSLWCAKVRRMWCDTWWVLELHEGCSERDKYEQDGQHFILLGSIYGFDIVCLRLSLGLNPPFPCSFIKLGSWALSVPQTDLDTLTPHTHWAAAHTISVLPLALKFTLCPTLMGHRQNINSSNDTSKQWESLFTWVKAKTLVWRLQRKQHPCIWTQRGVLLIDWVDKVLVVLFLFDCFWNSLGLGMERLWQRMIN